MISELVGELATFIGVTGSLYCLAEAFTVHRLMRFEGVRTAAVVATESGTKLLTLPAHSRALPPPLDSPHIPPMPAPKKPGRAPTSKASRPEVYPLGEHLAELVSRQGAVPLLAPAFAADVLDRIAVTVDKQVIAESDVIRYLRVAAFLDRKPVDLSGPSKRTAAAALVDRSLILEESVDSHFPQPSDQDAQALLRQVKAQYPSEAAYQAALFGQCASAW